MSVIKNQVQIKNIQMLGPDPTKKTGFGSDPDSRIRNAAAGNIANYLYYRDPGPALLLPQANFFSPRRQKMSKKKNILQKNFSEITGL